MLFPISRLKIKDLLERALSPNVIKSLLRILLKLILFYSYFLIPDSDINDLINFFTHQNIMVTMFNDSDYVSAAPHSAALNVVHSEKVRVLYVSTHLKVIKY